MEKKVVMTWEQLVALSRLLKVVGDPIYQEIIYIPEKYEWIRKYLECDQLLDYLSTGFNFLSPCANDLDFGYGHPVTRFDFLNKMSHSVSRSIHWLKCHWWALKNAYVLALNEADVRFPTVEELKKEYDKEYHLFESVM